MKRPMFVEEITEMYVHERGQKRRTQSCGEAHEIVCHYQPVKKNGQWPLVSLIDPTQLASLARWTNMLGNKGVTQYDIRSAYPKAIQNIRTRSDRVR